MPPKPKPAAPIRITELTVAGFKSIAEKTTLKIAPLTLLAGTNSSGKSSIMQPLLLLKQTLEAQWLENGAKPEAKRRLRNWKPTSE